MRFWLTICLFAYLHFLWPTLAQSEYVYQEPSDFVQEAFSGNVPEASLLIVTGERKEIVSEILGHSPSMIRVRYWAKGLRTAWVLEEIGKTKPITAGFIIDDGHIKDVRILIYRESHGGEVRHEFFTKQFNDATLDSNLRLSNTVDGISGATLSVNALKRLSALALYLDREAKVETTNNKSSEKEEKWEQK
jgi:hypothetical protein